MRALALAVLFLAATALAPATAGARTTWLCKPGLDADPCRASGATASYAPDGRLLGVTHPARRRKRIDCFYVYPTVSQQPGLTATKRIDPEVRSIARFQAARYSTTCRVFAPVYRQVTLRGIGEGTDADWQRAYGDVRAAWRAYLRHHNRGRGIVLIGHSQGTFHLRRLLEEEIEPDARQRRRIVSALLLGGNALEGEFARTPACRAPRQTGCVVAFSVFNAPVPPDALFGRALPGQRVLCTNPAALAGGAAPIDPMLPRRPFAPGTAIAVTLAATGFPLPADRPAPWLAFPDAYTARCTDEGGANALQIAPRDGAPALVPSLGPTWGLHLADANIALGDLEALVRRQAAAYADR